MEENKKEENAVEQMQPYEEPKPVIEQMQPYEEPKPVIEQMQPYEEPKPVVEQMQPYEEPKPVIEQMQPYEEPKPVVEQMQPYEEPKPVVEQMQPYEEPKPVIEQMQPYEEPKPVIEQMQPYEEPKPVVEQMQPYEEPKPVFEQMQPYEEPKPVFEQMQPYEEPKPVVEQMQPYEEPKPVFEQMQPYEEPKPVFEQMQPYEEPKPMEQIENKKENPQEGGTIIVDYFKSGSEGTEDKYDDIPKQMKLQNPEEIKSTMINTNPHIQNQDDSELQEIQKKTKRNKECKPEDFFKKNRHYFIMTDGGKPIYSRYGDEVENCGIFGTYSAMITKYTVFLSTDDQKEMLNCISNEKNKMAFMKKGQLVFIVFTNKKDSTSLLFSQLEFLYTQLLSILTTGFLARLEDNPSQCLTAMSGTEVLFEQLIEYTKHTFVSLLKSYPVLPLKIRARLMKLCEDNRGSALYCIIMTANEILALSHSDLISVNSVDILLIQNLILSNASLRLTESWVPLCLPGVSPDGYLQLYCQFTEDKIGICFVTEQVDPSFFMTFTEQYNKINEALIKENLVDKILTYAVDKTEHELDKRESAIAQMTDEQLIEELLKKFEKRLNLKEGVEPTNRRISRSSTVINRGSVSNKNTNVMEDMLFGICQHRKRNQYFKVNFSHNYKNMSREEKNLVKEYTLLLDKYKEYLESNEAGKNDKEYIYINKGEIFCNVIYQYDNYLLIASFNFFMDFEEVGTKAKEIVKYIKSNEKEFFLIFK